MNKPRCAVHGRGQLFNCWRDDEWASVHVEMDLWRPGEPVLGSIMCNIIFSSMMFIKIQYAD